MTKNKALYSWFSQFMDFYRDTDSNVATPGDVEMPYGTYTYLADSWGGEPVAITVNLWFRTESEAVPDEAAQEISDAIGYGGTLITCDEGYIWLKRGSPWCQSLADDSDPSIKRRYLNITAEYLTFT